MKASISATYLSFAEKTMFAKLATGGIDNPSGPPVNVAQLSAPMRTTSAAASVDRMKNGPRRRAQISASSAPKMALSVPPHQMPSHGVSPYLTNKIVDV